MYAQPISVTELNEYLRAVMDSDPILSHVTVRGEISNFVNHYKTGHFYFSLKDASGSVRAVMFRSDASRLPFLPENGMKVFVTGRVSVFPRDGQYQIYVNHMQPDGMGALALAFEQLRRKLEGEGLFDAAHKKPIPAYPEAIGVVTSPTGAAVRDIINVLGRRFPAASIYLYPALVQGAGAGASVAAGVRFFNEHLPVDVMIVGRGGGSAEDLFAFNDEVLAREVFASRIPVISAVGHEIDYTILDFVADLRAPTPSAAAELAVPDQGDVRRMLGEYATRLSSLMRERIMRARHDVSLLASTRALTSPRAYVEDRQMQVAYFAEALERELEKKMLSARFSFESICGKLETLNPLKLLSRGYAAVFDKAGEVKTAVKDLALGDEIVVTFADGEASATVSGIRERE